MAAKMDIGWKRAMWAAVTAFVLTVAAITLRVVRTSWADVPDEMYMKGVTELLGVFACWWMGTPDTPQDP